jgi:hypothetical protein
VDVEHVDMAIGTEVEEADGPLVEFRYPCPIVGASASPPLAVDFVRRPSSAAPAYSAWATPSSRRPERAQ